MLELRPAAAASSRAGSDGAPAPTARGDAAGHLAPGRLPDGGRQLQPRDPPAWSARRATAAASARARWRRASCERRPQRPTGGWAPIGQAGSATPAACQLRHRAVGAPQQRRSAIPMKRPCSTTPGTWLESIASESTSAPLGQRAVEDEVALVGQVGLAVVGEPLDGVGQQAGEPAARVAPREAHDLDGQAEASRRARPRASSSSATTTKRRAAETTIFSRRRAPPPPLIRRSDPSISSAPSRARSSVDRAVELDHLEPGVARQRVAFARRRPRCARARRARPAAPGAATPPVRSRARSSCRARPAPRPRSRRRRGRWSAGRDRASAGLRATPPARR